MKTEKPPYIPIVKLLTLDQAAAESTSAGELWIAVCVTAASTCQSKKSEARSVFYCPTSSRTLKDKIRVDKIPMIRTIGIPIKQIPLHLVNHLYHLAANNARIEFHIRILS